MSGIKVLGALVGDIIGSVYEFYNIKLFERGMANMALYETVGGKSITRWDDSEYGI